MRIGLKQKDLKIVVGVVVVLGFILFVLINSKGSSLSLRKGTKIEAEVSGSSPESGATSRLKSAYDSLVTKGANYGDSQPSDWTYASYGAYWNRILYAASWEPGGNATTADVVAGKTFYSGNNNRTVRIGTATGIDFSLQQYAQYDNNNASDYTGEESSWIQTSSAVGANVWKDLKTDLYWSHQLSSTATNSFTAISSATCDFFTTTPRGSYGNSSTDPDCGDAINACAELSLVAIEGGSTNTDWYLPSQKELLQAYIDGIYNQAGATFTTSNYYWCSTENSDNATQAWYTTLASGRSYGVGKSSNAYIRCVRRD